MSQCQAVNCEIYSSSETKDFNGCNILQSLPTPICNIGPSNPTVSIATCTKRSDITATTLIRTTAECSIPDDVNPISAQIICEEKTGCEWGYQGGTEAPIKKICKPKGEGIYTCDSEFQETYSRYSLVDPKTFGCDTINCEYTPVSKSIVVGQCIENTDNSVDSDSTIDCGTWTTKAQCLSPTLQDKCIWNANDESYCGYNRNIEKYIEDINSQENVSINNLNEISVDNIGDKNDPCKRIQNPSRESCESNGCLWDIYGNRNDRHHYNEKTNADGSVGPDININYYDINTTGLCTSPVNQKCMDYFCGRSSISNNLNKLDDGICQKTHNDITCSPSEKHIITYKTPGFITFLPTGSMYPNHLSRSNWGHTSEQEDNITSFNKLLGLQYNASKIENGDENKILSPFRKHYKENCEKKLIYPTSDTNQTPRYDFDKNKKIYDEDTDVCINTTETVSTNTMTDDTLCSSFYHKDLEGTYEIENSCGVFDINNMEISTSRYDARNSINSDILPDTLRGATNNPSQPSSDVVSTIRSNNTEHQQIISANLVCNRKFLEIITSIKSNLVDWENNFYYLSDISDPTTISSYSGVNTITKTNDSTLLNNFRRGSSTDDNIPSTNTDYYPINQIGAGLLINSFVYRANAIDTDSDFKNSLTNLFGTATITAETATWTPASGKIFSDTIKPKIEARILNIANKVRFGLISYDEYKEELSRFIASLLVYTGTGVDGSVKCAYDSLSNTYSSYSLESTDRTWDGEATPSCSLPNDNGTFPTVEDNCTGIQVDWPTIDPNNITIENLIDHYQAKGGTLDVASTPDVADNYYNLIGNSAPDATSLLENIETKHSIKDIVHRKGTAILTFQLYDSSGNKIEIDNSIKQNFFPSDITSIYFDKNGTSRTEITNSLKITQHADNDEKIFDINDNGNVYTIKDGPNIYVGGILEIEVDNIEPGCLGDLTSAKTCLSNIYMINSNDDYTSTNASNKLSLKEIRLKDNPIDIYFNGDIDGLYRKNEIISINGFEGNTFNNNLSFDSTNYYQIISDIDTINNKITIKNGTRKGKYFLGREDLEMNHYKEETTFCRNVNYDTSAISNNNINVDAVYCDVIHELYKYCKSLDTDGNTCDDSLCNWAPDQATCLPKLPDGGVTDHTSNTKCYEISDNILNTNMKPTKCPYNSDGFGYEFKAFYKDSSDSVITTNEIALTLTDGFYKLYGIVGVDQISFFDNWRIEYLDATGQKIIGKIHSHIYLDADNTSNIKIKKLNAQGTEVEEQGSIFILSIRPPKNAGVQADSPSDQFDKPSIVTIKSYLKKEVSMEPTTLEYTTADGTTKAINTKLMCDFNNGVWNNRKCLSQNNNKTIRGIDLCENTGYIFDQNSNLCYKEYNSNQMIENSDVNYEYYCSSKTKKLGETGGTSVDWDTNNRNNQSTDEYKKPCSVCSFVLEEVDSVDTHYCKALSKLDCLRMDDNKCGIDRGSRAERPGNGGILSTKTACEFYRHNANHENVTIGGTEKQVRYADFVCEQNQSVNSSACNTYQRLEECESSNPDNPTGCQWKCPYVSDDIPGYQVKLSDDTNPRLTSLNDRQDTRNYYSSADLVVSCKDGWEQIEGETPRAQCVQNPDPNTRNNHGEILSYLGCVKSLNCKNDIYTSESVNNLDPSMIPSEFKTNGNLDPSKIPTENGSFQCTLPKSLKPNPEGIAGWSEELCCQNVGLCSGNDISGNDVTCPTGQTIKQTYYGESNVLQPVIGTTVAECCEAPEAPTITQSLELTNPVGNITTDGSSESEEFRNNFVQDILTILNHTDSGIGFTVTSDMIQILAVVEPLGNNVEVTFKILKNTDGNVVNKENLSRLLVPGTSFTKVGAVANTAPHFRPYDPRAKYLYYSDKFKRGVTIEEVGISVFVTLSLCLFCLVILGIVLK